MYDRIAAQVFNTPLLVEATRLDVIAAVVAARMGMAGVGAPEFDGKTPEMTVPDSAIYDEAGGYYITPEGIAIVGMMGTMIHRGGLINSLSGLTSYTGIKRQFTHAMGNRAAKGIILDANTPGGSAAGAFDLGDTIYRARGVKPIYAIAEDLMTSAGYLLGSAADRVYATQTGRVGSIGVVMQHIDYSRQNERQGLNPTYIYAGQRKVDGNADSPLSAQVLARFQADIDNLYGMFVSAVERNRANLSNQFIRDTEAAVYMGREAVDVGLADEVANIEQVLDQMRSSISGAGTRRISTIGMETQSMPAETENTEQQAPLAVSEAQASGVAAPDAQVTAVAVTAPAAQAAEMVGPAVAERARIRAIMGSDAAKQNIALAEHYAYDTTATAAEANAAMQVAAGAAKPAANRLSQVMASIEQPNIGVESGAAAGGVSDADRILSNHRAARGIK